MQVVQSNLDYFQKYGYANNVKTRKALDVLLINRRNEFREIAKSLLYHISGSIVLSDWDEFILRNCLDVKESFRIWKDESVYLSENYLETFLVLRLFSKNSVSMIQLTNLLNIAYNLALEFEVIYKRLN